MPILIFFLAHWFLSLFFQSFYHHRYASHGMFTMSRFWERAFHVVAWLAQGSSYLNPRAYAVMHRRHHEFSDTELDPHSPTQFRNVLAMMMETYRTYESIRRSRAYDDRPGYNRPPEWPALEALAGHKLTRLMFAAGYTLFYLKFAWTPWLYLLLPVHFLMGPIHGAIVNWCGHKYGYRNYRELGDESRNTLPFDFVTLGELFQNNHHKSPSRANFAHRLFEIDPTYPVLRALAWLRIIRFPQVSTARSR
jgi:stearoyl-CoA desaturase (delta-9 desaturase)